MTRDVWLQWLKERHAQHRYDNSACPRVIYVDNISSHDATSEETKARLNKMNFFPFLLCLFFFSCKQLFLV